MINSSAPSQFGNAQYRSESVDLLTGKIRLWDRISVPVRAFKPQLNSDLDLSCGPLHRRPVRNAPRKGRNLSNVGFVIFAPVNSGEIAVDLGFHLFQQFSNFADVNRFDVFAVAGDYHLASIGVPINPMASLPAVENESSLQENLFGFVKRKGGIVVAAHQFLQQLCSLAHAREDARIFVRSQ